MARTRVKLDLRGMEAIAKGAQVSAAVKDAAEAVKANVEAMNIGVGDKDGGAHEYDLPVKVYGPDDTDDMRYFDRAAARVVLAHASGEAVQAKHGALTKAAAEAGLKVRGA